MKSAFTTAIILVTMTLFAACGSDSYAPKPKGYMRFDLPAKAYVPYDTVALPFSFEAAAEADVSVKRNESRLKWVDLNYPDYGGVIYLSYIPLRSVTDLAGEVDTSYQLLSKHFNYATGQKEFQFVNLDEKVYATVYQIEGRNVASTYQFWATDSLHHFLRGSLYIDCVPNNDSLAPILEYLQADIDHIIETLRWRE